MSKLDIDPTTTKYIVRASITADGVVEKPDIVGAVFGQTEGLLGDDLDLRDLQKSGRIGRIEVTIESKRGKTTGEIILPSSLDKEVTALVGAALESIDRVGPAKAEIKVIGLEDARASKRELVLQRAKELLSKMGDTGKSESDNLLEELRDTSRVEDMVTFGADKLPAGPNLSKSDSIIVVEGRNDVANLLRHGVKNAIAVEGTNVPQTIIDLCKQKSAIAFVDGDRGGELILKELLQVAEIDFIARAPPSHEVEEITGKQLMKCLRGKVAANQFTEMYSLDKDKRGGRADRQPRERGEGDEAPRGGREERPARGGREERGGSRDDRGSRGDRGGRGRGDREERAPRSDREERAPRSDREERAPRSDREERAPRSDREERAPRSDREERAPRSDREERAPRSDREERAPRTDREERGGRGRGDRPVRGERDDRRPRREAGGDDTRGGRGPAREAAADDGAEATTRSRPERRPRRDAEADEGDDDRGRTRRGRRGGRGRGRDDDESAVADGDADVDVEVEEAAPPARKSRRGGDRDETFVSVLDELSGKLQAVLMDDKLTRLGDPVAVRELADRLKSADDDGLRIVVFDGVITQRLLDIAMDRHIETLVGVKTGNITKKPANVEVLTRADLD